LYNSFVVVCLLTFVCGPAASTWNPAHADDTTASSVAAPAGPAEPEGYRMDAYRAATPATLAGATTVSTVEVRDLQRSGDVLFVDVLPRPPKPANLPEDIVWRTPKRFNIPGSVWLANVGYGALNPRMDAYFRSNLERLTGGNFGHPILFYCLADCWMSWNAAKRALAYGYTRIFWYPDGTNGWAADSLPLEEAEPVPDQ
jgi:PQQ-dependent catabolism-associated CXXCW motif protein